MPKHVILAALLLLGTALAGCGASSAATHPSRAPSPSTVTASATTLHYIANEVDVPAAMKLGFTLVDVSSKAEADALPDGVRGLMWVGEKCPTMADAAFKATIDRMAADGKVFGYYLSDEPQCDTGPAALASRADYVRQASSGNQVSFFLEDNMADNQEYSAAATHADLIGLDPYPCSTAHPHCQFSQVADEVAAAKRAGWTQCQIVPVFQYFSDSYYNLPTAAQEQRLLDAWARQVPSPVFDYAYSWGTQDGLLTQALSASPKLQAVAAQHNRATGPTPTRGCGS